MSLTSSISLVQYINRNAEGKKEFPQYVLDSSSMFHSFLNIKQNNK